MCKEEAGSQRDGSRVREGKATYDKGRDASGRGQVGLLDRHKDVRIFILVRWVASGDCVESDSCKVCRHSPKTILTSDANCKFRGPHNHLRLNRLLK